MWKFIWETGERNRETNLETTQPNQVHLVTSGKIHFSHSDLIKCIGELQENPLWFSNQEYITVHLISYIFHLQFVLSGHFLFDATLSSFSISSLLFRTNCSDHNQTGQSYLLTLLGLQYWIGSQFNLWICFFFKCFAVLLTWL